MIQPNILKRLIIVVIVSSMPFSLIGQSNTFHADYTGTNLPGESKGIDAIAKEGGYAFNHEGKYLVKIDDQGGFEWTSEFIGSSNASVNINSIITTQKSALSYSNYLVVGELDNQLYIGEISGQPGSEGDVIWDHTFANSFGGDQVVGTDATISKNSNGNRDGYVITGYANSCGGCNPDHLVFLRVDMTGTKVTSNSWNNQHVFQMAANVRSPEVEMHYEPSAGIHKYVVSGSIARDGFLLERDRQGAVVLSQKYLQFPFKELSIENTGNKIIGTTVGNGAILSIDGSGQVTWGYGYDIDDINDIHKDPGNGQVFVATGNHSNGNETTLMTVDLGNGQVIQINGYRWEDFFLDVDIDFSCTEPRYLAVGENENNIDSAMFTKVNPNLQSDCQNTFLNIDYSAVQPDPTNLNFNTLDINSGRLSAQKDLIPGQDPQICGNTIDTICSSDSCYADNSANEFYRVIDDSLDNRFRVRTVESDFYQRNGEGKLIFTETRVNQGDSNLVLGKTDEYGNIEWLREYPWSMRNASGSVIQVDDGYVVAGYMFDRNTNVNKIFLMKTDFQGNQQWLQTHESQHYVNKPVVRENAESELVVISNHSVNYAGENSGDTDDLVIMKTDQNGNLINYKRYSKDGRYYMNYTDALTLGNNNTLAIGDGGHAWDFSGGLFQLFDNNNDTIKDLHFRVQTPSGNYDLWGAPDERSKMRFNDVVRADNGNFIVVGEYDNSDQYGDGAATFLNGVIAEIDQSNYQVVWANEYQISTEVFSEFLDIDVVGNSSENGFVISGFSGLQSSVEKSFVLRVDRFGSVQWGKTIGGNTVHRGHDVYALANQEDVLVKGYLQDTSGGIHKPYVARLNDGTRTECIQDVGFEPSSITIDQLPYNSDKWTSEPTTRNPEFSRSFSCKPYLEACTAYPQRSRSSNNQVTNTSQSGKYTSERDSLAHTTDLEETTSIVEGQVDVYPNPVEETLNLDFSDQPEQRMEVILSSLEGKEVMRQQVKGNRALKVADLEAGMYLLELRDIEGRRLLIKKVVKEQ